MVWIIVLVLGSDKVELIKEEVVEKVKDNLEDNYFEEIYMLEGMFWVITIILVLESGVVKEEVVGVVWDIVVKTK